MSGAGKSPSVTWPLWKDDLTAAGLFWFFRLRVDWISVDVTPLQFSIVVVEDDILRGSHFLFQLPLSCRGELLVFRGVVQWLVNQADIKWIWLNSKKTPTSYLISWPQAVRCWRDRPDDKMEAKEKPNLREVGFPTMHMGYTEYLFVYTYCVCVQIVCCSMCTHGDVVLLYTLHLSYGIL